MVVGLNSCTSTKLVPGAGVSPAPLRYTTEGVSLSYLLSCSDRVCITFYPKANTKEANQDMHSILQMKYSCYTISFNITE